jgi:retron-type reverse transcriptase
MINFENQYFRKLVFTDKQIKQFCDSANHDLKIAELSDIKDVVFKFSYDSLIKLGIFLIAKKGYKVRSTSGHHVKILEKLSDILQDNDILIMSNKMRQERNINLYDGVFFISEKDSHEYLNFVKNIFKKAGIR